MRRRIFLARTGTAAFAATFIGRSRAQDAEAPIRIIVPFPPGGHPDVVSRLLSGPLGQALKRNIVIDNRSGAGGLIGAQATLQARADGNTMIMNTASSAVFVALTRDPRPFNPLTAFDPLAMLGSQPLAFAVGPSLPSRTLAEFVAEARKSPGKLSYGSAGVGSLTHVVGEHFKQQAGALVIEHVPYRGSVAAVTDLAAGRVDMVIDTLSTMQPFVRDGRIRQLAVLSDHPSEFIPGIPTARQQGVDIVAGAYNILALPAGVPRERFAIILAGVQSVIRQPQLQSSLTSLSMTFEPSWSPKECADFIAREVAAYTPVIKAAHINVTQG